MVGSSVWKSLSPTPVPAPVIALRRVDLPAFVYPASATIGSAEPLRRARMTSRFRSRRVQAAMQVRDAVARQAAVGLDLRLAGAPGADPATEPLEVGPQAPHPREVVLELGQLHLELALGAVGVVGEDVEDHGRPVDHRHAQTLLEVALLARNQLVVAHDEVRVRTGDLDLDLGELPAAEIAIGIRPGANLDDLADVRDSGGAQELLELREGIAVAGRG